MTTSVRSCDMNLMGFMVHLSTWLIRFISHERKQIINQYLYLHFPTQSM